MNPRHADMDETGEWAEFHPMTKRVHLSELPHTEPQGRPEQGWPIRRCSPEMACYEPEDGHPDETMSTWHAWLTLLIYFASVSFTLWFFYVAANFIKSIL